MTPCMHNPAIKTDYAFLARPPPQKKRPTQPLPSPPTSQATCGHPTTFSAIASWAAHVQPGSPASLSPRSPRRRPSLRRGRCPSATSIRVPSASFLYIAPTPTIAFAPTPSVRDFKADLTTVGYTSVFLQLPTPISATLGSLSISSPFTKLANNVSSPTCKPRGLTRFRSLSVLRSRGRSKSIGPHSPTKTKAKAAASAAIVKRKKTKYAMHPPPLANELALMQFMDGGSMDTNIKRAMDAQAKASDAGPADVYRDPRGGVWWDQDEELEYAHLLEEGNDSRHNAAGDLQWVTFCGNTSPSLSGVLGEGRRGSVSTHDFDPDPKHVVLPADSDDLALIGSAAVPLVTRNPTASILALPSRPRRAAQHLRKPDFLVDATFLPALASPRSPKLSTSSGMGAGVKPRGKARRRPAPLKLSPPSLAFKQPTNSPIDADKVRREFIDDSFEPKPLAPVNPATPTMVVPVTTVADVRSKCFGNSRAINMPWRTVNDGPTGSRVKTKPSMLNMMGLFRSARKEDMIS